MTHLLPEKNMRTIIKKNNNEKAYDAKANDKIKSVEDPTYKVYAFDLQQVLPTPYLSTNKMFYLRQLSTYNLTIHDCTNGESGVTSCGQKILLAGELMR